MLQRELLSYYRDEIHRSKRWRSENFDDDWQRYCDSVTVWVTGVITGTRCARGSAPINLSAVLRQRAIRLVPHVAIGTTSPSSLVNIQTVLWADTGATRNLGTVRVLGQPVRLRLRFATASWTFGDGAHDTTRTPGVAYPDAGTCRTARCPAYYGHVYDRTGQVTLTLGVTWRADYALGAGAWTPIAGAVLPGPTATRTLHLREARGVLVPTPQHS